MTPMILTPNLASARYRRLQDWYSRWSQRGWYGWGQHYNDWRNWS